MDWDLRSGLRMFKTRSSSLEAYLARADGPIWLAFAEIGEMKRKNVLK